MRRLFFNGKHLACPMKLRAKRERRLDTGSKPGMTSSELPTLLNNVAQFVLATIKSRFIVCSLFIITLCSSPLDAFVASTNFFQADDPVMQYRQIRNGKLSVGFRVESGTRSGGKNILGNRRNMLAIYNDSESVLKMVENPLGKAKNAGAENLFRQTIFTGPFTDDGTRGHVSMNAKLTQADMTMWAHYVLPIKEEWGWWGVGLYIPTTNRKISGLSFKDHTNNVYVSDRTVRAFIKNIPQKLKTYGDLSLEPETVTGFGDAVLHVDYVKDIRGIHHKVVDRASIYAGIGLMIPSGVQKDEDKLLSMPAGFDGSWGVPIKVGGWVDFKKYFQMGFDAHVLALLDRAKMRRLKTNVAQTDLFLLNKGHARKNHGLHWQAHWWAFASEFYKGFFAKASYQFVMHHGDSLFSKDEKFKTDIINTANNLKGWYAHNLIVQVGYNLTNTFDVTPIAPMISVFYKLPLAGKAIVDTDTIGGQIRVNF